MFETTVKRESVPSVGDLKLVVSSTPRSGTFWMSNVIKNLGVGVGHEVCATSQGFRPGRAVQPVEVSGFSAQYLVSLKGQGVKVVHLVRNPVATCNSILRYFPGFFGKFPSRGGWEAVCEHWLVTHAEILNRSSRLVVLEDCKNEDIGVILETVGVSASADDIDTALGKAERGRKTPGTRFSWLDLPSEVAALASHLGYSKPKTFGFVAPEAP